MLLSTGLVWLVATAFFVLMDVIVPQGEWWLAFLFAVPASAIVVVVLSAVFKRRKTLFISVMILIWTLITSIHVSAMCVAGSTRLWPLYLLGIPLQILEIVWMWFRGVKKKSKYAKKTVKKGS